MVGIFISYSRKDQAFVRKLFDALKAAGRDAWVDWEGIPPTAQWLTEVYGAIDGADSFIFVLSPDSVASPVCGEEVTHALADKKRVIPIVCRQVTADAVKAVPALAPLAALNWIFFRETDDFTQAFAKLRFALDTDLDYWHLSSDLLVRAKKWEAGRKNANLTLRGPELASAERWLTQGADKEPRPTALQLEYINASRRDAASRARRLLTGVSVALIVTLILAVISSVLYQQTRAENAQLLVKSLAGESSDALTNNRIDQALLLGAEAVRRQSSSSEARDALFSSLEYSPYLQTILQGGSSSPDPGRSVAFSADGQTLLSAGQFGHVTLWDVTAGRARSTFVATYADCNGLADAALSPDGKTIATVSQNCGSAGVDLWSASGAHEAHLQPSQPFEGKMQDGLAFSPDGKMIAVAESQSFGIWDVSSDTRVGEVRPQDGVGIDAWAAFSPDGATLATGNIYAVSLWHVASRSLIHRVQPGAHGGAFSLDGGTLVLASGSQVSFVATATGALSRVIKPDKSAITSAAMTPDGASVVFNDQTNNTLQLWNVGTDLPIGAPLQAHRGSVVRVVAGGDGRHFASIGSDAEVVLWRTTPFTPHSLLLGPKLAGHSSVAFSADGHLIATCDHSPDASLDRLTLWDVEMATPTATLTSAGCFSGLGLNGTQVVTEPGTALAFSPDGKIVAQDDTLANNVKLWSVTSPSTLTALRDPLPLSPAPGTAGLTSLDLAFSRDGRYLAALGLQGNATVWETSSWAPVQTFARINGLAFSPDGRTLALATAGDTHGQVLLWNVGTHATTALTLTASLAPSAQSVAYSPDGKTLVAIDTAGLLSVWDAPTGQPAPTRIKLGGSHLVPVASGSPPSWYHIAFSPDGATLAASDGIYLALWDVNTSSALVHPIFDPQTFYNVAFSPDGQYLAEAQVGGPVILRYATPSGWQSEACRIANRNLTQDEWGQFLAGQPYHVTCPNLPPSPAHG